MYPETEFFQISGFRAHSNGFKKYDDTSLINAIFSDTSKLLRPGGQDCPIELVLGILPSGASYLLMSTEQMLAFTHKHRLSTPRSPWRATDFLSLSPIYFDSRQELSAKFAAYRQRPRNKNRRDLEETQDNSQANRGYVRTDPDVVHYRAYFENQRTLYRLLTRDVAPSKIGLAQPSWLGNIRVVSLVFGEWTVDNRRRDDCLNDPRLVEVGWTDALFANVFEPITGSSTVHLKLKTPSKMINPDSKSPHFSEVVEDDEAGLYLRLRTLLSHESAIPVVILVHDEAMAREVLGRAGIDVESYTSGLTDLLPLSLVEVRCVSPVGPTHEYLS
ncbi:hypothetical protein BS17DRAFT_712520 [Gyrodon lividus]|nr:hypothetical protein BS17DRAFT_712520 [Gyrodon lividus]